MGIKSIIRRIILGHKANSASYIKYLRAKGMRIGERTIIFRPDCTLIDETRPWLIEIGDDVQITQGVTILTHGYDWSVLKGVYGEVLGSSGKVTIGNNVFIGVNSTILKGVTVGSNVIIGAGSLVNKDIPDGCVAAGSPAKVIMSLEEYYQKRKAAQKSEAMQLVSEYRRVYGKDPDEQALREFFWLFTNDPANLPECWSHVMDLVGNRAISQEKLKENKALYPSMEAFLEQCRQDSGA